MTQDNPLEILFATDLWATRQILDACERLSPEQFSRKFEMGFGSLQATITHLIASMRGWSDALAQREFRQRIDQDGKTYSLAELRTLLHEAAEEFRSLVYSKPLAATMTRERGGKVYTFTYAEVATQVMTHGFHHRAQCLNMLRHVGVSPLPPASVLEWTRATGGKA